MVADSLTSVLDMYGEKQAVVVDGREVNGRDTRRMLDLEERYMQCMHYTCHRRDVWDVGLSMTKLLEEYF